MVGVLKPYREWDFRFIFLFCITKNLPCNNKDKNSLRHSHTGFIYRLLKVSTKTMYRSILFMTKYRDKIGKFLYVRNPLICVKYIEVTGN